MSLLRQPWYLSDQHRIFGPLNAFTLCQFLLEQREAKDMHISLSAESGAWIPLRELGALIDQLLPAVRSADHLRVQTLTQIMNCYLVNKNSLRLGQLRQPRDVGFSELPYSWLTFGGDWFREVELELQEHLGNRQPGMRYTQNYKAARVIGFHSLQAWRLISLVNQARVGSSLRRINPWFAVSLSVIPVLFMIYMQERLNELWTFHLRRLTRRSERFAVNISAELLRYPSGGARYTVLSEGHCQCLGFGGARLELTSLSQKVKIGDELFLAFPSAPVARPGGKDMGHGDKCLVSGRVAWTTSQSLGVKFVALNKEQEMYLTQVLQAA